MKNEHSIALLCQLLGVSASGFYAWSQRVATPGPRAMEDQALSQEIRQICATSRPTYGSPRVVLERRSHGRHHSRRRVARLMSQQGLCGRQKGRYRVQTTDSNQPPELPIAPHRSPSPGRGAYALGSPSNLGRRHHLCAFRSIRTPIPILVGQHSGTCRTGFRF